MPVPDGLVELVDVAQAQLACARTALLVDYYAHQALRSIPLDYTPPGLMAMPDSTDGTDLGAWAFAGGTSLLTALRVIERVSEDIDLVVFASPEETDLRILRGHMRQLARRAASGITAGCDDLEALGGGSAVVRLDARPALSCESVRIDVSPCWPHSDGVSKHQAMPLLGRYATGDLAARPDLRAVTVPVLSPAVTASNKLAALHRFATSGELVQLAGRARDVYDLASLARRADLAPWIRQRIPDVAAAPTFVKRRSERGRPPEGYAASPAFDPATDAYAALQVGYEGFQGMIFGKWCPPFAVGVALAQSLDDLRATDPPSSGHTTGRAPSSDSRR